MFCLKINYDKEDLTGRIFISFTDHMVLTFGPWSKHPGLNMI